MCLVEVEKSPKPVASCAMPANPGMNIKTDTPLVKKAREGVMEFLLANHPLDCPICDQGGECDLQDQAMMFGSDRSRFTEVKRAVQDKNLGPLVKTVMTRCIHCTRCVRFAKEVAGIEDLGVTGRGRDAEIGTYVQKTMQSELSGNVVDLCPVGALTSKPTAFTYRSWELRSTDSIDTSDALGSNIRVDARGSEVMRIMPRLNESINQEWISDKTRYQFDGLRYQRLVAPMVKNSGGHLEEAEWPEALAAASKALSGTPGNKIRAIAGKLADAESMVALKDLMNRLDCGDLRHESGYDGMDADLRASYVFNSSLAGVDEADAILMIGTNPRVEGPVLNARIRAQAMYGVPVGVIGSEMDLTYPYDHLGTGANDIDAVLKTGSEWLQKLSGAHKPMIIVGSGVLRRGDRDAVMAKVHKLAAKAGVVKDDWSGLNILHDSASSVTALDVGFIPSVQAQTEKESPKVVYLLGSDDYKDEDVPADAFVIYQGHHGDKGAARANVILPGAAYTEKYGTYVNTEGRAQTTKNAVAPIAQARNDWEIIRALSEVCGKTLPVNSMEDMRNRLADVAPHLASRGMIVEPMSSMVQNGTYAKFVADKAKKTKVDNETPLGTSVVQFYQTDAISRASKTMARCIAHKKNFAAES
jgi:NADH dehydrogenase (ubiquinone) Fe-S protein 1